MDGHAGLIQLFEDIRVEIAPYLELVDLFTDGIHLHCVVGIAHEHAAGKVFYVSVYVLRLSSFRNFCFLKPLDEAVQKLNLCDKLSGVVVHGL